MKKTNRINESLKPLFSHQKPNNNDKVIIFSSPSDVGVRRNFGRNGARFAPETLLTCLKKLNNHTVLPEESICVLKISTQEAEKNNFEKAQKTSAELINETLAQTNCKNFIHLGGGHDHAYPLLSGFQQSALKKILIFNIDAHCDTRVDDIHHSGTPFRDFDNECNIETELIQYGIHSFANSKTTLQDLKKIKQQHLFFDELYTQTKQFTQITDEIIKKIQEYNTSDSMIFFSLDCDALEANIMEAVSAVNHKGLPFIHVNQLLRQVLQYAPLSKKVLGIYEYNPLYENLSQKGARAMAALMYDFVLFGTNE